MIGAVMALPREDNRQPDKKTARVEAQPNGRTQSSPSAAVARRKVKPRPDRFTFGSVVRGFLFGILLAVITLFAAPKLREYTFAFLPDAEHLQALAGAENLRQQVRKLEKGLAALRRKFERMLPRDPYLIVDSSGNKIYVKAGNKLIHEGLCSTGSNVLLKAATDKREWMFATPRGMHRVIGKVKHPVWRMPDWAFIEEGRPVPPVDSPERYETGVLGDYALAFGNGYLIHGTLYKRMLGMPVTHGCVRLDDSELEVVYKNLQIGSRIFIY